MRVSFVIRRVRAALTAIIVVSGVAGSAREAKAQLGGLGGRPGQGQQNKPTTSSPTKNNVVGPRSGASEDDEDAAAAQRAQILNRGEPTVQGPADPLEVPPEVARRIGSDADLHVGPAEGSTHRQFFPFYEESKGTYRFRTLPPFFVQEVRNWGTPKEDEEGLYAGLYYRRRSPEHDLDVVFPLVWKVRDRENHVVIAGPVMHRQAPGENDNWVAPLFFQGKRPDGGYFHSLPLLTTSHWSADKAFTVVGPYFRDRTLSEVDTGVAPLFFHGDNGDIDGARKRYTLIPPLLYYHRTREIDSNSLTVVGPVLSQQTPERNVFDVLPFYWSIRGNPATGGVRESHTTLLPFFHYGTTDTQSLFVVPGYLRRVTLTADTMLTPFYSYALTRKGAATLEVAGPLLPFFYRKHDRDTGASALGIFPFYYGSHSPASSVTLTPLFGRFETTGVSHTTWAFPTLVLSQDRHGWESDFLPIAFLGRHDQNTHTVLGPVFWDFANPKGRVTIGFPVYWRFADKTDSSVTQVAGNTVYVQRRVPGGLETQFHVVPVFSYGQTPQGNWWNLFFGLAGYEQAGSYTRIKAFWIPITVSSSGKAVAKGLTSTRAAYY
jgi:hypothetical protein